MRKYFRNDISLLLLNVQYTHSLTATVTVAANHTRIAHAQFPSYFSSFVRYSSSFANIKLKVKAIINPGGPFCNVCLHRKHKIY